MFLSITLSSCWGSDARLGSVSFGCIAPNSHRDFQATYSASKRNPSVGSVSFGCIALNIHRDFQATYSASKRNRACLSLDLQDSCFPLGRSLRNSLSRATYGIGIDAIQAGPPPLDSRLRGNDGSAKERVGSLPSTLNSSAASDSTDFVGYAAEGQASGWGRPFLAACLIATTIGTAAMTTAAAERKGRLTRSTSSSSSRPLADAPTTTPRE